MTTTTPFDAAGYKATQQREWDAAAPAWGRWWNWMDEATAHLSERLLDLADVGRGDRVLDIATGIGEPAMTAARRVGPRGHVTGTDLSPGMIAVARERADAQGLDNVEFRVLDAEQLDHPPGTFDAALCRFGLMFLPDLGGTLARIGDVLRSGGRLVAAVWGPPERSPFLSVPMGVVMRELQLPPPAPGTPGVFALADHAQLIGSFERAGFTEIHTETTVLEAPFVSAEHATAFVRDTARAVTEALRERPPELQERVWAAVTEAFRAHAAPDGSLRLTGEAVCIAGTRP